MKPCWLARAFLIAALIVSAVWFATVAYEHFRTVDRHDRELLQLYTYQLEEARWISALCRVMQDHGWDLDQVEALHARESDGH